MTVVELITQLQQYDPNRRVVVRGYEDGCEIVNSTATVRLVNDPKVPWFSGDWQRPDEDEIGEHVETMVQIFGGKSANWEGE